MALWEPSIIIASPLPLENVHQFVLATVGSTVFISMILFALQKGTSTVFRYNLPYFRMLLISTCLTLLIIIQCGASPRENIKQTMLASLFISTLACGFLQPDPSNTFIDVIRNVVLGTDTERSNDGSSFSTPTETSKAAPMLMGDSDIILTVMNQCVFYGTIGVTTPFMILNILDHGSQIQRWPVPILLGGTVGYIVGNVIAIISGLLLLHYKFPNRKKL